MRTMDQPEAQAPTRAHGDPAVEGGEALSTIFDAHAFAIQAHAEQIDKGGRTYIRHLERVANASVARAGQARFVDRIGLVPTEMMQAALLHDVLEDTATTQTDPRSAGFPEAVVTTVRILTKSPEPISYATRIGQIIESRNLAAILINMSDNEDNLGLDRTLPAGETLAARYRVPLGRLK